MIEVAIRFGCAPGRAEGDLKYYAFGSNTKGVRSVEVKKNAIGSYTVSVDVDSQAIKNQKAQAVALLTVEDNTKMSGRRWFNSKVDDIRTSLQKIDHNRDDIKFIVDMEVARVFQRGPIPYESDTIIPEEPQYINFFLLINNDNDHGLDGGLLD